MRRFWSLGGRRVALCAAVALVASACADGSSTAEATELDLLTLSEPTLEIGVLDGADEYLFGSIASVAPLGDGSVAVADAGSVRISLYGEDGSFIRTWGQRGDGPGEFQNLSRLYPVGADSVMVAHGFIPRVTVFDTHGEIGREMPAVELTGDTVFALDSWLYGRFWVDGALTPAERADVRVALDALPRPRQSPGYRSVRVADDGRLWVREPRSGPDVTWTRVASDGTPEAVLHVPARFGPTYFSGDEILGAWRDETDVHFVRRYRIEGTGTSVAPPAWLTGGESAVVTEAAPDDDELMSLIRGAIKNMASYQEIHYAGNMSYTTDIDALDGFEKPEGLDVDFTVGSPRGWAAVFAHQSVDRLCGLAYGFDLPPGWTAGMVLCGEPYREDGEG